MTNNKFSLVTSSDLDSMTITSSPVAETLLPVDNVKLSQRERIARWTGSPTNIVITGSILGTTALWSSGFGIARATFENDVTVRLRLYAEADQTGTVVYDSTATSIATVIPWGEFVAGVDPAGSEYTMGIPAIFALWYDAVQYKSYQIDIYNPSATVVDIGRIYIGLAWQPSANFDWGSTIEWVDESEQNRSDGGGILTEAVEDFRRFEITFSWLTDSDRTRLSWILGLLAKSNDALVSLDPSLTGRSGLENTMICKRVNNNKFARNRRNKNSITLILEEA